jgi:rhodanese-related sulfurtransferase
MSDESSSTIGRQRLSNYALLARSSDEFVHLLTDNQPAAPEYFAFEVDLNRRGAAPLSQLPELKALTAAEVVAQCDAGAVVVDTRPEMQFASAHLPGSIHIALTGQYASWAARILGLTTPLIVVGEDAEHVRESQMRLARVGIENVAGYLEDGVVGWVRSGRELDSIPQITAQDLARLRDNDPAALEVLDVREGGELETGAIENSRWIPLGNLKSRMDELDRGKLLVVHCKGGYRSSIAASILRRAGFKDIANLIGGIDAWKMAGLPCVPEVASADSCVLKTA